MMLVYSITYAKLFDRVSLVLSLQYLNIKLLIHDKTCTQNCANDEIVMRFTF